MLMMTLMWVHRLAYVFCDGYMVVFVVHFVL